jgi:hypothetical protein
LQQPVVAVVVESVGNGEPDPSVGFIRDGDCPLPHNRLLAEYSLSVVVGGGWDDLEPLPSTLDTTAWVRALRTSGQLQLKMAEGNHEADLLFSTMYQADAGMWFFGQGRELPRSRASTSPLAACHLSGTGELIAVDLVSVQGRAGHFDLRKGVVHDRLGSGREWVIAPRSTAWTQLSDRRSAQNQRLLQHIAGWSVNVPEPPAPRQVAKRLRLGLIVDLVMLLAGSGRVPGSDRNRVSHALGATAEAVHRVVHQLGLCEDGWDAAVTAAKRAYTSKLRSGLVLDDRARFCHWANGPLWGGHLDLSVPTLDELEFKVPTWEPWLVGTVEFLLEDHRCPRLRGVLESGV